GSRQETYDGDTEGAERLGSAAPRSGARDRNRMETRATGDGSWLVFPSDPARACRPATRAGRRTDRRSLCGLCGLRCKPLCLRVSVANVLRALPIPSRYGAISSDTGVATCSEICSQKMMAFPRSHRHA